MHKFSQRICSNLLKILACTNQSFNELINFAGKIPLHFNILQSVELLVGGAFKILPLQVH